MDTSKNTKAIVKENIVKAIKYCNGQVRLAEKAQLTQGAISKYKRGEMLPTGVAANKLSKAVEETQPPSDFAPHIFKTNS